MPVAIETIDEDIAVLDATNAEVLLFSQTGYGKLINEAVALRYDGDESQAVEKWKEVLKLDSNYELAYVGIGKSYLAAGENKLAMKYLKLGMDKEYYSIAFKRYRNDILKENLGYILTGVVVVFAAYTVYTGIKKRKREEQI
jgi:tetratricopeptide (TPR) repeat protein